MQFFHTIMAWRSHLSLPLESQRSRRAAASLRRALRGQTKPSLTEQDRDVLALVTSGLSSKEIAGHLHLGVKTIRNRRQPLMSRTGARNVAGLIRVAQENGIVPVPELQRSASRSVSASLLQSSQLIRVKAEAA